MSWEATDPRDKIWGFLGISEDGQHLLPVDYSLPVNEVYHSFAMNFIKTYNSLRVLQTAGVCQTKETSSLDMPSWVPDWRSRNEDDRVLDIDGSFFCAAKGRPADVEFSTDERILKARGIAIDKVKQTRESNRRNLDQDEMLDWVLKALDPPFLPAKYITGVPLLQAYFRTVLLDRFEKTRIRLGNGGDELILMLLEFYIHLDEKFKFRKKIIGSDDEDNPFLALGGFFKNDEPIFLIGYADNHWALALFGRPGNPGAVILEERIDVKRGYSGYFALNTLEYYNT